MSDKGQAAWEAWKPDYATPDTWSAFHSGYAAAYADCEAMVREAVKAALEEAAKKCDSAAAYLVSRVNSTEDDEVRTWCIERHSEAFGLSAEIRALDPEPIVRRVMKETANVTEQ